MFRFSLLSILCVYVTASAAFAHEYPHGYSLFTLQGIEFKVGINARRTGHTEPNDEGWHYHTYTYTIELNGKTIETTHSREVNTSDTDTDDPPPTDNTPVDPPPTDNNPQIRDSNVDLYHCHSGGWHYHRRVANEEGFADNHDNHHNDHSKTGYEVDDEMCRNTEQPPDDNTGGTPDPTTTSPTNTDQTPTPTTTPIVVGGGGPPAVEESGTPEGTSKSSVEKLTPTPEGTSKSSVGKPTPTPADPKQVFATEWILLDLGRSVPQWIEFYNANPIEINLKGWKFHYAVTQNFKTHLKIITLTDFLIPAGEAAILATAATKQSTVDPEKVYNLDIGYVLKSGWKLTDADGTIIHAIGEKFTGIARTKPPYGTFEGAKWRDVKRVSHKNYPSGEPTTASYYGHRDDITHPGHHEPVQAAPSSLRRITMWGKLKQ